MSTKISCVELQCPNCRSKNVAPTAGNGVGNTMDCLTCYTDFTPPLSVAVQQLRNAIEIEGRVPRVHRQIMARHRLEWPALWRAIENILAATETRTRKKLTQSQKALDTATRNWAECRGMGQGDWGIPEDLQTLRVQNGLPRIEWNNRLSKLIHEGSERIR